MFFDKLSKAGYQYDSSLFPAGRGHGGQKGSEIHIHGIKAGGAEIIEFPISITKVLGRAVCFSGGGYFRLFPYGFTR